MKAIEENIYGLCTQIDNLRDEVDYWREKYETLLKEYSEESNSRMQEAQKGVANALMFALSVREGANGDLVIPAPERKELAESWRK